MKRDYISFTDKVMIAVSIILAMIFFSGLISTSLGLCSKAINNPQAFFEGKVH